MVVAYALGAYLPRSLPLLVHGGLLVVEGLPCLSGGVPLLLPLNLFLLELLHPLVQHLSQAKSRRLTSGAAIDCSCAVFGVKNASRGFAGSVGGGGCNVLLLPLDSLPMQKLCEVFQRSSNQFPSTARCQSWDDMLIRRLPDETTPKLRTRVGLRYVLLQTKRFPAWGTAPRVALNLLCVCAIYALLGLPHVPGKSVVLSASVGTEKVMLENRVQGGCFVVYER